MKKYFFFLAASLMMGGCDHSNHNHAQEAPVINSYGASFDPAGAIPVDSVTSLLATQDSVFVKFTSTIEETCSVKGCWMTVKLANGETARVRMKDYGFFVPTTGAANLKCTVAAWAYKDVTSVEDLKHYAQDAGKSEAEIAAITEPKSGISFMADGIMIEGYKPAEEHHEGDGHDHHEGDGHDHEHHEGDGHTH
ncbi:MAG: DUF4920 domain-containing protein [Flavobacteriales bacterium]